MRPLDHYEARLANVPLFRACSKQDLRRIARLGDACTCRAGEVLVREGGRGNELYVIVAGEADVNRDGGSVATLTAGDYFGELAVLRPAPRTATVTAITDMDVLIVTARELAILLADVPLFARKLLNGMAGRLQEADAHSHATA
ncbi:MAG TPA: cyclic nucleotide-binding domain-containing protein [Acidimicrobiales bacterium]|jgi:CRP-like cAMP-binding protein|nr:cyclic nucleotide-binding domain-containing protein [Acidimicrobiales bacterium]